MHHLCQGDLVSLYKLMLGKPVAGSKDKIISYYITHTFSSIEHAACGGEIPPVLLHEGLRERIVV